MNQAVTITVTQEDIDAGEPETCEDCPIARAMTRTFERQALVYREVFEFYPDSTGAKYHLPYAAQEFIQKFDFHGEGKPFSFNVEVDELYVPTPPATSNS